MISRGGGDRAAASGAVSWVGSLLEALSCFNWASLSAVKCL